MACRLKFDFTDVIGKLDEAMAHAPGAARKGLYDAAGIVAAEVAREAGSLPFKGSTVGQIVESVGITRFERDPEGGHTSVGCSGYFAESGFPIPFFVREVENGKSRIPANPFMKRAANRVKRAAEAAGSKTAEEHIKQFI